MHPIFKLIIAGLMLLGAIGLFIIGQIGWGIIVIILIAIPVILYFFHEYMLLALFRVRKQDIEGAQKWLGKIKNPEKQIIKSQRGYYYYLVGVTEGQKNVNLSEKMMKKALSLGLRFDHDKAIANMNLAVAAMTKGRKQEAERHLAEAQKLDKGGMISNELKMLKQQLKKVNIPGGYYNPNMRRR